MGFAKRMKNAVIAFKNNSSVVTMQDKELAEWLGIKKTNRLSEETYFTCMKILTETMGKLPLKYYQKDEKGCIKATTTDDSYVLTVRPNPIMTPTTFWGTVEMNCQHHGNGFVWLRREFKSSKYGGTYKLLDAWVLPSNYVNVIMDDKGVFGNKGKLWYKYTDKYSGEMYLFKQEDVLHIKTWCSLDGILGQSVRDILFNSIDGAMESQSYMHNLYKSGLSAGMALQYTGNFEDTTIQQLQRKFADKLCGSQNAGKVIPVPIGLQLTPLKMNMTDAQFFELRKYSALSIAAAFGIKPNHINNFEKSSYSNSEMQNMAFLTDTMAYRLKQYEEELNAKAVLSDDYKNGYFYKFNEKALLRTDAKTQMEILAKAVNNGIYSPNEAREYLQKPLAEGGDILMVNGNYIPITDVGKQYSKGGD